MTTTPRRLLALAAAVGFATLLSACATPGPGSASSPTDDSSAATHTELDAAWLDAGRSIAVVTTGSSTCAPTAGEVSADGQSITVEFVPVPADTACTRDMAPRATVFAVPEGVDPKKDVSITVTGDEVTGTAELAGDKSIDATPGTETDYAPSAGWLNEDSFVILTWGSSTCVPVIYTVETAGRDALAVAFVEPPTDQVCTADMAPRTAIASTAGLDMKDVQGDPISLTLSGAGFDQTIGILGKR